MPVNPIDLASARVLVSNDDGINAPGIKVLEKIARDLAREVWVCAPESEQSAAGHSLTRLRPLHIRKASGDSRYAVDGSPTDSALLGVRHVMKDAPPDLVLSGINPGGNLCDDITYSGTIAVAMEASLLGIPGIALSLAIEGAKERLWETVEAWAPRVLGPLCAAGWEENVILNVNFPNIPADQVTGIAVTAQGVGKTGQGYLASVDPHGTPIYWLGTETAEERYRVGADVEAVKRGAIAVTPLSLDLTHTPTLRALGDVFR